MTNEVDYWRVAKEAGIEIEEGVSELEWNKTSKDGKKEGDKFWQRALSIYPRINFQKPWEI